MKQTITIQRELTLRHYMRLYGLVLAFLLTSTISLQAQKLVWSDASTYATDVSVGYSQPTDILLCFEVQDAPISNAVIKITLPNNGDLYATTFPVIKAGGNVTLGAPTWNAAARTITFPAQTLTVGQQVYYKIPRLATTAIATSIGTGTVKVDVTGGVAVTNGTKNLGYNYLRSSLVLGGVTQGQQSNLTLNFGNNDGVHSPGTNTSQTYKLRLTNSIGSADSVKISFTFAESQANLSNWKIGGSAPSVAVRKSITTGTSPKATYILVLMPSDLPGGDGFQPGELVDITVDVLKKSCGNADVALKAYWGGTDASPYGFNNQTGSFVANPGESGTPNLVRVGGPSLKVTSDVYCMDGVTPNLIQSVVTNTGNAMASNIVCEIGEGRNTLETTTDYFGRSFIDFSTIRYKIGINGAWKTDCTVTATATITSTFFKPEYRGKPIVANVYIPQDIQKNKQDTLYLEWGAIILPEPYMPGVGGYPAGIASSSRYDVWNYTDQCGSLSMTIAQSGVWHYILKNDNVISSLDLKSGQEKELILFKQMNLMGWSGTHTGSANSELYLRIIVPKNKVEFDCSKIKMKYCLDETKVITPYSCNFAPNATNDSIVYLAKFKRTDLPSGPLNNLYVTVKNISTASVNEEIKADISIDYCPTGTITGSCADIIMPRVWYYYPTITLINAPLGVTYEFDNQRKCIGFKDYNNEGIWDNPTDLAEPGKYDNYYVYPNDSALAVMDGKVLSSGAQKLYAILYVSANQSIFGIQNNGIPDVYLNGVKNPGSLTLKLDARNTLNASNYPNAITTTLNGGSVYAYTWEISGSFNANDEIRLEIPYKAIQSKTGTASVYNFSSWFYSTTAGVSDPLNPGISAVGEERYMFSIRYITPYLDPNGAPTVVDYLGKTTKTFVNGRYLQIWGWATVLNEYRCTSVPDSIVITVPNGYVLDNVQKFRYIINSPATSITKYITLTASSSALNTDTRKTFILGSDVFDVDRNDPTKIPLGGACGLFSLYPELTISSTYRSPLGSVTGTARCYVSNDENGTQANIPLAGKSRTTDLIFYLNYIDPGSVFLDLKDPSIKKVLSSQMSWNMDIRNSKQDGPAYDVWLYLDGPVKDASFGSNTGTGEGNRWVYIPGPIAISGGTLNGNLKFTYTGTDCNNQTVKVYPIFDRTQTSSTAWQPYPTLNDASFDLQTDYIYSPVTLTLQNPDSRIGGEITSLAQTPVDPSNPTGAKYNSNLINVDDAFPVELVFSTQGAEGAVVHATAKVNFFKGLSYVAGSAYYDNGTTKVAVGATMETLLQTLDGTSDKTLDLSLIDAGITEGEIIGNSRSWLRFKLMPTCSLEPVSKQLTMTVTGNKPCGDVAINSGAQVFRSDYMKIDNIKSTFSVTNKITSSNTSNVFSCQSTENASTIVYKFAKTSGASQSVTNNDSIRISVPEALKIDGTMAYNYPAVGSVAAATGTFAAPDKEYVFDGVRTYSWALNKPYYDALAASSLAADPSVEVIFTMQVKLDNSLATSLETGAIKGAVVSTVSIGTCPSTFSGDVASDEINVTINPSPVVTQPANIIDCPGTEITPAAFTGNFTNTNYGYQWKIDNLLGLDAGSYTTNTNYTGNIPTFTLANAGSSNIVGTVTVTPTYGTCVNTTAAKTFTITVYPKPTITVTAPAAQCASASSVDLSTTVSNLPAAADLTSVKYYSDLAGTDELTSTTVTPTVTTTYYVQVTTTTGCKSAMTPILVKVNATPTVTKPANMRVCQGSVAAIALTGTNATHYTWTVDKSIGLADETGATPKTSIPSFSAVNTGTSAVTATVTITPQNTANGVTCTGTPVTFTIIVHPTPVAGTFSNQSICSGKPQAAITPVTTGEKAVTYYTWARISGGNVGLADYTNSDNSNLKTIPAFTAVTTTTAIVATFEVTPHFKAGNVDCTGTPVQFTYTVNPLPVVTLATDKTNDEVCVNTNITFTTESGKSSYVWSLGGGTVVSGGTSTDHTVTLKWSSASTPTVTVNYTDPVTTCTATSVTSKQVTVHPATAINTHPSVPAGIKLPNGYIIPGSIVPLSVAAVGHNLTYQWYWKKASDATVVTLSDNSKYTGSTTANLTINNAYETENGDYYVIVTGTCNTATSTPVTVVAVANQDASLKDLKVNGTTLSDFNSGKTDYIMAIACDEEQITLLGIPNNAGATVSGNGTFALQPGDNYFPVKVVAQDMVTTRTYTVNVVRNCYVPKIKKDLDDAVICLNGTHTWTIEAEGENLTYEWYKGETRIMGQNTPSITFTDAKFSDYDRYYVVVRSNHNGFKSSIQSKKVRLWVADYLPEHLRLAEYPNPATVGKNYHLKVDGYVDVTKYSWSYSKSGVTFSPAVTLYNENETWATFGSLSVGTGTLKVTMEHPCGTRELTQTITVNYPTGVDDVTATVVTVYPNPTSGMLKVSGTVANQMIRVTDVTGSLKGSYKTQEGTTTIDLTGYAKGTYLVQYNGKAYKVIRK